MKKIYTELQVNVISLDNADVIATSYAKHSYFENLLDGGFDIGDFSHQNF